MILELEQVEFECLVSTIRRVMAWEAPMALAEPDLEDPVYCLARAVYLDAETGMEALRRAR
jgi:hypothetical protein